MGKDSVVVKQSEFLVWHRAFGLTSRKEELEQIHVCSKATNLATLGTC